MIDDSCRGLATTTSCPICFNWRLTHPECGPTSRAITARSIFAKRFRSPGQLVATLINGGVTSFAPDGSKAVHTPCPDVLTTNACFAGPNLRTLYVTLSTTGRLIAFDNWPTKGLKLNFQA